MSALGMACMNSCLGGSKEKFGLKYCVTEICSFLDTWKSIFQYLTYNVLVLVGISRNSLPDILWELCCQDILRAKNQHQPFHWPTNRSMHVTLEFRVYCSFNSELIKALFCVRV